MISKKLNCIYIHIPKTGGMSIESILGEDIKSLHKKSIKVKHGTPSEWEYPNYWENFYTFTFVRNPWDRIVSSYMFNLKMSDRNSKQHDRIKIKKYGIDGFNEYVINDLENTKSRHFLPYSHWVSGYKYDFIGKIENFKNDMSIVCNKLGINFVNTHINKSKREEYTKYYNDQSKDVIANIYKDDIINFNYSF